MKKRIVVFVCLFGMSVELSGSESCAVAPKARSSVTMNPQGLPFNKNVPSPALELQCNNEIEKLSNKSDKELFQYAYQALHDVAYSFVYIDHQMGDTVKGSLKDRTHEFLELFHVLVNDRVMQNALVSDSAIFPIFKNSLQNFFDRSTELAFQLFKNSTLKGKSKNQAQEEAKKPRRDLDGTLANLMIVMKEFVRKYGSEMDVAIENECDRFLGRHRAAKRSLVVAEEQAKKVPRWTKNSSTGFKNKMRAREDAARRVLVDAQNELEKSLKAVHGQQTSLSKVLVAFDQNTTFLHNNRGCKALGKLGCISQNSLQEIFGLFEKNPVLKTYVIDGLNAVVEACHEAPDGEVAIFFDDMKLTLQAYITQAYVPRSEWELFKVTDGNARGRQWELCVALYLYQNGLGLRRINVHIPLDDLVRYRTQEFDMELTNAFLECKNRNWRYVSSEEVSAVSQQFRVQSEIAKSNDKEFIVISAHLVDGTLQRDLNSRNIVYIDPQTVQRYPKYKALFDLQSQILSRA